MNLKEFFDAVEQLKKEALPEHLNCNAVMVVNNTAIVLEMKEIYLAGDGLGAILMLNANKYNWEGEFVDPAEDLMLPTDPYPVVNLDNAIGSIDPSLEEGGISVNEFMEY